ncbi:hypothetical protein BZA77DRAFT_303865 [Pyronema omphalodes]|nr:hypothetical protein BZA77DRAFT_303865 [Pyronema omphalodes]
MSLLYSPILLLYRACIQNATCFIEFVQTIHSVSIELNRLHEREIIVWSFYFGYMGEFFHMIRLGTVQEYLSAT